MLLWLWCSLAATTPIQPLAWEPPYAVGAAQENGKETKKKKKYSHWVQKVRGTNRLSYMAIYFVLIELQYL